VVTVNPHLYKKLGFSVDKDIVPITYLASFNQMLVCNPKTGFGNLPALLKTTRKVQKDVAQLLLTPEMKAKLLEADLLVVANMPSDAAKRAAADSAKWGWIARMINLTLD
jgi:hypothetical protein